MDAGGRRIRAGDYDGSTRTFHRVVRKEHVLQLPCAALAFHVEVVHDLQQLGCLHLEAHMPDGSTLYVPFSVFRRKARLLDRGHGRQLYLPLAEWKDAAAKTAQLALFEEVQG